MRRLFSLFLLLVCLIPCAKSVDLAKCDIVYSSEETQPVATAARLLSEDIERVTGKKIKVREDGKIDKGTIFITTIDNPEIVKLSKQNKIDLSRLQGQWESYLIEPKGKNLYIIGSDPRGAAYGALRVSKEIGVNPYYWWADVPVKKKSEATFNQKIFCKSPAIKYRGIFINDEDWGLYPWAAQTFDKEYGTIGPKTYAKVCELLLRLGGNMLAPAMHICSGAFYSNPENQKIAAEYGILITTSHCEPLLLNNAISYDWDSTKDGPWDYGINKDGILKRLDKRIAETKDYLNIYTMGMRGLHDEGMRGDYNLDQRTALLNEVIKDERNILTKHLKMPIEEIPQIYVPYKEAMEIYNNGLEVPEDITLVWPDDNYGYMKRVSNPKEQMRDGNAGVYYHISYLGPPHHYLWLSTTSPAFMYEELNKAYLHGADRYWLLNMGDIKPMELGIYDFFDMAWNMDNYSFDKINNNQSKFLASIFGENLQPDFQDILDNYYRLAWDRKPEYMGYERQWDGDSKKEGIQPTTDFSFIDGSAQKRLADYKRISRKVKDIEKNISPEYQPAFFEMVAFPVFASEQMNRKFLMAQLNHETGDEMAAIETRSAFDSIISLAAQYNELLNGKWNHMMSVSPWFLARYHEMPELGLMPQLKPKTENKGTIIPLSTLQFEDPFRLIKGLGTDWEVVQLGEVTSAKDDPNSLLSPSFKVPINKVTGKDVKVEISVVPVWPLYPGTGNSFGVSVDGCPPVVCENVFSEFSEDWKNQVLVNSKTFEVTLPLDTTIDDHYLLIIKGDPGQMIQKIKVMD